MKHSFDIDIATKFGIAEAILFDNLYYWIAKNKANEVNHYDGRYWTYNSVRAFEYMFPYFSKNTISRALSHLEKEGLIISGNYNKVGFDRTKWYALTDLGESIYPKADFHLPKIRNGFLDLGEPIPNINTDNKPNTNNICANDIEAFFNCLWKEYPKKKGKGSVSFSQKRKLYKLGEDQMHRCISRYKEEIKKNKTADKYVKNGSTFFNSGYIDYLDENYEGSAEKHYEGVEYI